MYPAVGHNEKEGDGVLHLEAAALPQEASAGNEDGTKGTSRVDTGTKNEPFIGRLQEQW